MSAVTFSVVIPTLNEEERISGCLDAIYEHSPDIEVIVADGGSTDRTVELARNRGARVCHSAPGRDRQCNAGVWLATGEIILFLHADTRLPPAAFSRLMSVFNDGQARIGYFELGFDDRHFLLRLLGKLSEVNTGWFRFGDSCITIRRDFFFTLGGFQNQALFEDLDLLRRAARFTSVRHFKLKVITSARRFTRCGVGRQLARNLYYTAQYLLGVPADAIAVKYQRGKPPANRDSLLMMVRCPNPGRVKSRLAVTVGDHRAADIYRECAERLFAAAEGLPGIVEKRLFCADAADAVAIAAWAGNRFDFTPQPAGDLGHRLQAGFAKAFNDGIGKAIIVASDVPGISTGVLAAAFRSLDYHDAVIGPSPDGGYYLIGLKQPAPQLFENIDWSTSTVLAQTLSAAQKSGLSVELMTPLQDIDTAADWQAWQAAQSREPMLETTEPAYA